MSDNSNILAILLDIKESSNMDIDDELIKQCYELQKKYQYDPERNTLEKMRDMIEKSIIG